MSTLLHTATTNGKTSRTRRDVLTTGEVSQLFQVAPRTVVRWVDEGFLAGHRLPGSSDRRIHRDDLLAFAELHGYARVAAGLLGGAVNVLAVGLGATERDALAERLPPRWALEHAPTAFQAGAACWRRSYAVVLLHYGLGRSVCREVALAFGQDRPPRRLVCVVPEDARPGEWLGVDGTDELPADATSEQVARALTRVSKE